MIINCSYAKDIVRHDNISYVPTHAADLQPVIKHLLNVDMQILRALWNVSYLHPGGYVLCPI